MLAEPKRKTIYSLNPRGKFWSEDKNGLGHKLLKSMGWEEGLGLGKNNNGIKDNIKVNINCDNKGLGYKSSADDVWFHKNNDFEQLLADLAVHHNNTSAQNEIKVSNLEEISKRHKNRLKAKNLSQCSQNDLNSIFPNKRFDCNQREDTKGKSETQIKTSDNTFESNTNINEYFKSKINKLKLKSELNQTILTTNEKEIKTESKDNIFDNEFQSLNDSNLNHKKQKSKKRVKINGEKPIEDLIDDKEFNKSDEQNIKRGKKRKSKRKDFDTKPNEGTDSQSSNDSQKFNKKIKFNTEKYVTKVPKGYNSNNLSVNESIKNYHKICNAIAKDKTLNTTNLMALKGYGYHYD